MPIEWHAGDEMSPAVIVLIVIAVAAAVVLIAAIRIVREYGRVVEDVGLPDTMKRAMARPHVVAGPGGE